jgi:cytochrome c peroxidase
VFASKNIQIPPGEKSWYKHANPILNDMEIVYGVNRQLMEKYVLDHAFDMLMFHDKMQFIQYIYSPEDNEPIVDKEYIKILGYAKRYLDKNNSIVEGDRNAMAIANLAWSNHFFWDGRRSSLEGQAHDPVTNPIEMKNDWNTVISRLSKDANYPELFYKAFKTRTIDSNLVVKAIAQFERSLVSFNSPFDKFYFESDTNALTAQEKNGLEIFFNKGDCNHCHSDVLLSDDAFRNNGLDATFTDNGLGKVTNRATDNGKFKVVSLRNIEVTAPYMHDGRFKTLEEVVNQYNDGIHPNSPNMDDNMQKLIQGIQLTNQEKQDLVAFLKTFTDREFLTNKAFSNPN